MIHSAAQPAMPTVDLDYLKRWIGRTETIEETLAPMPSAALLALFDRATPAPETRTAIPPLGHWLHFLPVHRQSELGHDGHAEKGGFIPPVPLPRRMFAGANITFHRPLHIGERARRVGTIMDVVPKTGRSGPLVFVKIRQEISGEDGLALTEDQDIVYRTPPSETAQAPAPTREPEPRDPEGDATFLPDNVMLFRYSALLFNAHRIHYDHAYATGVDAYPGLVVHGQLVATVLADYAARHQTRPMTGFHFRSRNAFFADNPVTVIRNDQDEMTALSALDPDGVIGMEAEARFA